jgi:hypothetical protein
MIKKGKPLLNSNDGQEILGITYNPYEYFLVTVTEDYVLRSIYIFSKITVWSSLNGMEINRYKNVLIRELHYISYASKIS